MKTFTLAGLLASSVHAWPFVSDITGINPSEMNRRSELEARQQPGSAATCPFNSAPHQYAAPITSQYPYCGAAGGVPGKQSCVNNLVPAKGDKAHQWVAPGKNDIRGPCPGLNTAANHAFLGHDGITNFTELVDMQQNVYGVGYDLAVLLATLGVGLDGDPVTTKLSIGCDASNRTAAQGNPNPELGLDGHNKFEGDTSLTRNDYFPANGDNFSFNKTLYSYMLAACNNNCSLNQLAAYRYARYQMSLRQNGNFYYGPKSLLLYGAASFLYELFPSLGDKGTPDTTTMNYFFTKEQLPPNWFSRATPYSIPDVASEINKMYMKYPVAFGGNTGKPNSFVGIGEAGPYFSNNKFSGTPQGVACLLYQFATENTPSSLGGGGDGGSTAAFQWAAGKLNPIYKGNSLLSPCPLNYNSA